MPTRPCATCRRSFEPIGKARYCGDDCRHGTDAGYNHGCDCGPCRRAHARNHKRLRVRPNPTVPAAGTHRRVQALARLGWSTAELSRRLGRHRSYVLKAMQRQTLEPATVLAIRGLYDELCMTWCTGPTAGRTAAHARRQGWPPPLAWDDHKIDNPAAHAAGRHESVDVDPIVVERVLAGHWDTPTTRAERIEIVAAWRTKGRSLGELARLSGWKPERYYTPDSRKAA